MEPLDEQLWVECNRLTYKAAKTHLSQTGQKHALAGVVDGGSIKVFLVDGNHIKVHHDMDFVEGGNGLEDPKLCAKDEIVLDGHLSVSQLPYVCYHEAVERRHMAKGDSYEKAHKKANDAERQLRKRALQTPRNP